MSSDPFEFSNSVGSELSRVLAARAEAELAEISDADRMTAMLGAALIAVAEVLREPVEQGVRLDSLMSFCDKWLRELLAPVSGDGKA